LLHDLGFRPVSADLSFWYCPDKQHIVYITSVVDDMLSASGDTNLTLAFVKRILSTFPGTHKGIADHFVGMKLTWLPQERAVILNQPSHIDQLIQRFKPPGEQWYPRSLPVLGGLKMCVTGTKTNPNGVPLDTNKYPYRALIGGLNYLACCTRPDISYVVSQLSKYANAPTDVHWEVAIDCLKYLMGTKHLGIKLGHSKGYEDSMGEVHPCVTYVDSSFAPGIDDTKSVTGYVMLVHGGPVMWASRTQQLVATSSTEAEYRAMAEASKDALWLAKILELFEVKNDPLLVLGDNKGAMDCVHGLQYTKHTKHIEVQLDFMRERYARGEINYVLIPGKDNTSDVLTKALHGNMFAQFRQAMGMAVPRQEPE
jgi:hypothetical protein